MSQSKLVWDLPLRLFHWSFAATIIGCWITNELGNDYIDLHMQLGYVALGLVIFRVIWGIIGTKHARFASFFPTPNSIKAYLSQPKDAPPAIGHNPLGSLMVFAMLALVLAQAVSGLFVDDDVFSSGPYYNALGGDVDKVMAFIHHNLFDFIIAAIALHIAAVLFYQFGKKHSLVPPMIHGKKQGEHLNDGNTITSSKLILALIIAAATAAFVYWLVVLNVPEPEMYY
ncbi:MAG: cytochrome b/b6 domain-containing protein [Psychrobium sp.]